MSETTTWADNACVPIQIRNWGFPLVSPMEEVERILSKPCTETLWRRFDLTSYEERLDFEKGSFETTDLFSCNIISPWEHSPHFIPHSFHFDPFQRHETARAASMSSASCLFSLRSVPSAWNVSPKVVEGAIPNPRSYSAITMQHFVGSWAYSLTAGELGSVPPSCSAARAREWPSCNVNPQSESNDADWLNDALPEVEAHLLLFTDANENIMGNQ